MHLDKTIDNTNNIDKEISKLVSNFDVKSYIQLYSYYEHSIFAKLDEANISKLMNKIHSDDKLNNISILYSNTNIYIIDNCIIKIFLSLNI